ncbi:MAG: FKBP-type peptidyl-prolyl cis-trans isomerase [Nanoarchaeota archaeon]
MTDKQVVKESDFVEVTYSGYANGQLFDSNIPEEVKKLSPDAKPEKTIIVIGQKMLVPGLDKQLEGKEVGKEYEIEVTAKEGFGERNRNMIKTISLKAFTEQKINPQPGMMLTLDNALVKIIAVSGARVTADFNNPMAGKDLTYKITITRFVTDDKEKSETILKLLLRFVPEFEVTDKVTVKGPKVLEGPINLYKDKFKELVGKELAFEEKKPEEKKKEENLEDKIEKKEDPKE